MFPPRFASDPLRVSGKPARHGINEAHLEIESWLIALDPDLPEPLQDGADILVLELDGSFGKVLQQRKERTSIGSLVVPTPRDFLREHREIAFDGQVAFGIAPGTARHRNASADQLSDAFKVAARAANATWRVQKDHNRLKRATSVAQAGHWWGTMFFGDCRGDRNPLKVLVGAAGFEPTTPSPPD